MPAGKFTGEAIFESNNIPDDEKVAIAVQKVSGHDCPRMAEKCGSRVSLRGGIEVAARRMAVRLRAFERAERVGWPRGFLEARVAESSSVRGALPMLLPT